MNRVKLSVWVAAMLLGIGFSAKSQDVHFSQYYANPVYLNPAYAGTYICPRLVTNFRLQWPQNSGKYTSYSASYDQHFDKLSGGIGVLFLGDRAAESGQITTHSVGLIYSFNAVLSKRKKASMRLAVQATYQQKRLDFNKLTFEDMIDPKYGFVYRTAEKLPTHTKGVFDFSTGIVFYSEHFYGGLAVNHFTQPKESFYDVNDKETRLPMKITANFGAVLDIKQGVKTEKSLGDMSLSPNIIFQYQNRFTDGAVYSTINYGMYWTFYPMAIGAWFRQGFRNADAAIFLVGLEQEHFKVGYSYDFTIPSKDNNKPSTGGAHEISAQFYLPCPQVSRRIQRINCPKF
ncbi:MAG: PorP/SprF family type IX secretion system membrane protein [Lentimicrobiaceae bacterium]|nr:PorP/SprF family type IX secretion system membrane protein [Lentimicrobiaceae bacterium]